MFKVLHIEWLKIKYYPAFWWVIGIMAVAYVSINFASLEFYHQVLKDPKMPGAVIQAAIGNPFSFAEVWHTAAYLSSFFVLFPAIVVIMLITNEYSFKTHRQNIINGWSRKQFIAGKLMDVAVISIIVTLLYVLVCLVLGLNNQKTNENSTNTYYIGYFLLQTFSQLSIAFLVGFLLRKSFFALGFFIFLSVILEPILVKLFASRSNDLGRFLPFEISDRMIPAPAFFGKLDPQAYEVAMSGTTMHFVYTLAFTTIIWISCFRLNAKRDF
jgi:ABC-2 type transport system permease protein